MGRIKTRLIKKVTNTLFKAHTEDMKKDFNENKQMVGKYVKLPSKKMRNIIAGYATRLSKAQE
ncbi:30S ribosomal protein S17e [Candidatus Woesearchaeota archaeon]|nr:MAG: 30S ribosomal protein S17e [Candidatus Woesearchaeota archaeon]